MKKQCKKTMMSILLTMTVLAGLFVPVYASGTAVSFSDDFSWATATDDSGMQTGGGVKWGDNWTTSTTANSGGNMKSYAANGKLYVKGHGNNVVAVNMSSISGLSDSYKISACASRGGSCTWYDTFFGIRFCVSADEQEYYMLGTTRSFEPYKKHFFQKRYKNTDGTYTTETINVGETDIAYNNNVVYDVEILKGVITYKAVNEATGDVLLSGTYTDESPLVVKADSIPLQLTVSGDNNFVAFDDVSIKNIDTSGNFSDDFSWATATDDSGVTAGGGVEWGDNWTTSTTANSGGNMKSYAANGKFYVKGHGNAVVAVNLKPIIGLSDSYKISASASRGVSGTWYDTFFGIRFCVSADEQEYYALGTTRSFEPYKKHFFQKRYKNTDGTYTTETINVGETDIAYNNNVVYNVEILKGVITYKAVNEATGDVLLSGTYTDESPLAVKADSIPLQLTVSGDNNFVAFDDVSIKNIETPGTFSDDFSWATATDDSGVTAGGGVKWGDNWTTSTTYNSGGNMKSYAANGKLYVKGHGNSVVAVNVGSISGLSDTYKISACASRGVSGTWYDTFFGIRFCVSADEQEYYMLGTTRSFEPYKKHFFQKRYKNTEGTYTTETINVGEKDIAYSNNVVYNVEICNNVITYKAVNEATGDVLLSGTYTDKSPLVVKADNIPLQLTVSGDNNFVAFDDVLIKNIPEPKISVEKTDDEAAYDVTIVNPAAYGDTETMKLIAAYYVDNMLVKCQIKDIDVSQINADTYELDIQVENSNAAGRTGKLFLWNINDLQPLTGAVDLD